MSATKRIVALALCIVLCIGCLPMSASAARDFSFETELADRLNALNLFKGTGNSYALESPLTRPDSVIMLLRLYGELSNAKAYNKTHPFTDVPSYADLYISYAKDNGLAYGRSDTLFGSENVTAAGYLTFVLRALGYSDKGGKDFTWDNPFTLADEVGILPGCVDINNFLRADVVSVSYAALSANMADGSGTLAEKLIRDEVFSQEDFDKYYDANVFTSTPGTDEKPVLDSEAVYVKCSPAVFRIDVYDAQGTAFASGSGFFIDEDGTAVTNYHVLDGAHSAKATLTDGTVLDILGVYDYDKTNDWAVVQVPCGNYKYLTIGDSSTIVGGAKVYALGSPLGLDDTFSDGMVSNANRIVDGVSYIQISAPISHGSSGGALINKYGEVIGICSAGFVDGQNLNLAIPITCIEGFTSDTVTPLAELFPSTGSDSTGISQLQAYDVLVATIANMQTGVNDDGYTYYYEQFDEENYLWFTDYTPLWGEVEVCVCYSPLDYDIEYWAFLYLSPDGESFEYYLSIEEYSTGIEIFEGYVLLDPTVTEFIFDEYGVNSLYSDMASDVIELGNEIGNYLLLDVLIYTDAFLSIANTDFGCELCSVADFGFTR